MRNVIATACVITGGFIYISSRSGFRLLDCLTNSLLWPHINSMRFTDGAPKNALVRTLVYSVPDALWCAAFILLIRSIWQAASMKAYTITVGLTISVCFAQEILQLPLLIPGTFDPWDLLCIAIAVALSLFSFASVKERAHWRRAVRWMAAVARLNHHSSTPESSSTI